MGRLTKTIGLFVGLGCLVALGSVSEGTIKVILPRSVEIAKRDLIVVTEPVREGFSFRGVGGVQVQTVSVETVLKGELDGRILSFTIDTNEWWQLRDGLEPNQRYTLELENRQDSERRHLVRATKAKPAEIAEIRQIVENLPPWSPPVRGISVICVPEHFRREVGQEIDVWFGLKNVGKIDRKLSLIHWPPDKMAHVELDVRSPSGDRVEPLAFPHATRDELEKYFSETVPGGERILRAGEDFFLIVSRIESAKLGMGYKQRLGFRYYPMQHAGRYRIEAAGIGYLSGLRLVAQPFTMELIPPVGR